MINFFIGTKINFIRYLCVRSIKQILNYGKRNQRPAALAGRKTEN